MQYVGEKFQRMKAKFAQKVGFVPSEGQRAVLESDKRFRIVLAGARFGKSMLAGFEIAFYLMFPDFRVWCVAPVYELADKELNWALEFLGKYRLPSGYRVLDIARLSNSTRGSREIKLPWGSFAKTKSTEKPQSLLGEELDMIVLCEAACLPREPWERMLRARIGPREGRVLAPSTGAGDANIFAEFVENGRNGKGEFEDWQTWEFSTIDNPTFDLAEFERARKELDENVFDEQYGGKLISRRGLVFRFSPEIHIVNEMPNESAHWPVMVGMQPGYKNPNSVVIVAYDREQKTYWVIDEIYQTESMADDIIPQLYQKTKGRRVLGYFTDFWKKESIEFLKKAGLAPTVNEDEKKIGRTQATICRVRTVQNVLRKRENGVARLHILKKCENVIEEFKRCKWPDPPKDGSDKIFQETPLPRYFQLLQALSHVICFSENACGVPIYSMDKQKSSADDRKDDAWQH